MRTALTLAAKVQGEMRMLTCLSPIISVHQSKIYFAKVWLCVQVNTIIVWLLLCNRII